MVDGKAGILSTYGLDSGEVAKLSGEIRGRLERMGFRIPTILEIRDERPSRRISTFRLVRQDLHGEDKVGMRYSGSRRRRNINGILFRKSRDKRDIESLFNKVETEL
jgi:hypothetical protein